MYSRAVEAPLGALLLPHWSSAAERYFSTYGQSSSSWPPLEPEDGRCTASRSASSSHSIAICQAPALASAVGRVARAGAARSCPATVLSRASSSAIRSPSSRPFAASAMTSVHRRSWSTTSPSTARSPSSSPCGPPRLRRRTLPDVGAGERQLLVATRQQRPSSSRSALSYGPQGRPVPGRGVVVRRRSLLGIRQRPHASVSVADLARARSRRCRARHLRVPRHVPGGAPGQRARQRLVETGEPDHAGRPRALVEPDLGVGQVALVQQDEVRLLLADQPVSSVRSPSTSTSTGCGDEPPSYLVVHPDPDRCGAGSGTPLGGLLDRERRNRRCRPGEVRASVLTPGSAATGRPTRELAPGRLLQRGQEVAELGVAYSRSSKYSRSAARKGSYRRTRPAA